MVLGKDQDDLLQTVGAELETTFVPDGIEGFPGFDGTLEQLPALTVRPPMAQAGRAPLIKPTPSHANEFLLVTGISSHYLGVQATVANCRFHDWNVCHDLGQHKSNYQVAARSVTPRSFFYSGEEYHCAHRVVHDRRDARCHIDAFEEFLCCRTCTFQALCWPADEDRRLPCGS